MKFYYLQTEYRKGGLETSDLYSSFEAALADLPKFIDWTKEECEKYTEYGSSLERGCIYTEEFSTEIHEINGPDL